MKRKLKHLGLLTLAMSSLTLSNMVYGATESTVPTVSQIETTANYVNNIDKMYYEVFGAGFPSIQQDIRQVNRTIYDDGLRMEILSTVTIRHDFSSQLGSSNKSFTFFTLTDETGDRVSEDMALSVNTEFLQDVGSRIYLIDFDESTKTATFVAEYNFFYNEEANDIKTHEHKHIVIDGIVKDFVDINEILEDISISEILNSHTPTFTTNDATAMGKINDDLLREVGIDKYSDLKKQRETLVRDQLEIPIEGWESAYISNIALIDDMLHVQTNILREQGVFRLPTDPWYEMDSLINSKTGETIYPVYSIVLDNYDEDHNIIDNRYYEELVFHIEDTADLPYYFFNLVWGFVETVIHTDLEIEFYTPVVLIDSIFIDLENEVLLGDLETHIRKIEVLPLGMSFELEQQDFLLGFQDKYDFICENLELVLIYEDGREQDITRGLNGMSGSNDTPNIVTVYIQSPIINMENLLYININGTVIDIR